MLKGYLLKFYQTCHLFLLPSSKTGVPASIFSNFHQDVLRILKRLDEQTYPLPIFHYSPLITKKKYPTYDTMLHTGVKQISTKMLCVLHVASLKSDFRSPLNPALYHMPLHQCKAVLIICTDYVMYNYAYVIEVVPLVWQPGGSTLSVGVANSNYLYWIGTCLRL